MQHAAAPYGIRFSQGQLIGAMPRVKPVFKHGSTSSHQVSCQSPFVVRKATAQGWALALVLARVETRLPQDTKAELALEYTARIRVLGLQLLRPTVGAQYR